MGRIRSRFDMLGSPPSGFRHASTAATPLSPERMGRANSWTASRASRGRRARAACCWSLVDGRPVAGGVEDVDSQRAPAADASGDWPGDLTPTTTLNPGYCAVPAWLCRCTRSVNFAGGGFTLVGDGCKGASGTFGHDGSGGRGVGGPRGGCGGLALIHDGVGGVVPWADCANVLLGDWPNPSSGDFTCSRGCGALRDVRLRHGTHCAAGRRCVPEASRGEEP